MHIGFRFSDLLGTLRMKCTLLLAMQIAIISQIDTCRMYRDSRSGNGS